MTMYLTDSIVTLIITLALLFSSSAMQCSRPTALKSFFHQITSEPTKVGWVGSGCSVATEPTSEITQFYNITQVARVSV